MEFTKDLDLRYFDFWAGAKDHNFTSEELEQLDYIISDIYIDSMPSETDINDLFWFEAETLCEWLNIDYDEYLDR